MTDEHRPAQGCSGRNVVITGGLSGLGRQLVHLLRERGCNIIMVSRSASSSERVAVGSAVKHMTIDLASMEQVVKLSAFIAETFSNVDVLINNAGTLNLPGGLSTEGIEYHLAVNYLSHFTLTKLLADRLGATRNSVILNIGSAAANQRSGCSLDDFLSASTNARIAYERSKWAISAFSFAVSDFSRKRGRSVESLLLQPPFMDTGMVRNNANEKLRSRSALALIRRLGAFTDSDVVARSALELIDADGEVRGDYATWSKSSRRFNWTDRPAWSFRGREIETLLVVSERALERALGRKSEGPGPLW